MENTIDELTKTVEAITKERLAVISEYNLIVTRLSNLTNTLGVVEKQLKNAKDNSKQKAIEDKFTWTESGWELYYRAGTETEPIKVVEILHPYVQSSTCTTWGLRLSGIINDGDTDGLVAAIKNMPGIGP